MAIAKLRYDESELTRRLEQLPVPARAMFAAACAERLLPGYRAYAAKTGHGDPDALSAVVKQLWKDLEGTPISEQELDSLIETATELIPPDDEKPWVIESPIGEDATAATLYALTTRQTGSVQDAAWAARSAFEAVHEFVVNTENVNVQDRDANEAVMFDPSVQAELHRQLRDLTELFNGTVTVDAMRSRAEHEGLDLLPRRT
jgi:uncharacterized protein YjaG (DUF416 family)